MPRDMQALKRHYEIERELADRLRNAPADERKALYRTVYDELFRRVPDHPQLTRKQDPALQESATQRQMQLLSRWLRPDSVYLEIGPGDCHLAKAVARRVRQVYAVDISDEITGGGDCPGNFTPVASDGVSIPVPAGSVTVAYSHQLLEHLHPDDSMQHLEQVHRALAPGGVYVCVTPHRCSGPHDISRHFGSEVKGFHLKEYTYDELRARFHSVGFRSVKAMFGIKGHYLGIPFPVAHGIEQALGFLPGSFRRRLAGAFPLRCVYVNIIEAAYA